LNKHSFESGSNTVDFYQQEL
jgi:tRNA A-37 threonylcarbamoyl transferase component Bud32